MSRSGSRALRALFVMEQHLGHQTYYQNLRRFLEGRHEIEATWAPVAYAPAAVWEKVAGLPSSVRGALRGRREVLRALKAHAADVCFFNTQVPAVLGGWRARRRPYVVATDLTPIQYDRMGALYGHRADRGGVGRWFKRWSTATTCRGAAWLLPWSGWAARSLTDDYGADPSRVVVLPPGVDLERWQPGSPQAGDTPRILFVGGDFLRKGGRTLLEAFRGLAPGAAELSVVTKTELPEEPHVCVFRSMEPNSPDLIRLYRSSAIFVLPTEAEAFGIAAVEAAATGLPIVASAVGGLEDVVAPEETGLLIPPGNAVALRQSLQSLLADPDRRLRMGAAARRRAEARFDGRRNAETLVGLLIEAAGRRS